MHIRDGVIQAIGRDLVVPELAGASYRGPRYAGARLACAEAIDAGITTVHDWAHNIRDVDYAHAGLRALRGSGLLARFSYGCEAGHHNERPGLVLPRRSAPRARKPAL